MTHTPGPWKVCNFDKSVSCTIDSFNGVVVAEPLGPEGPWGSVKAEHEANANLIAAAPELLEALMVAEKWMTKCLEADTGLVGLIEATKKARQAIAKAEGGVK